MGRTTEWWESTNGLYGAEIKDGVAEQTALTKLAAFEDKIGEPGEIDKLKAELAALKERERWIPVEEGLPSVYQNDSGEPIEFNVMIMGATVATTLCFNGEEFFAMDWEGQEAMDCYRVTHWRPLPEPPKKEEV